MVNYMPLKGGQDILLSVHLSKNRTDALRPFSHPCQRGYQTNDRKWDFAYMSSFSVSLDLVFVTAFLIFLEFIRRQGDPKGGILHHL